MTAESGLPVFALPKFAESEAAHWLYECTDHHSICATACPPGVPRDSHCALERGSYQQVQAADSVREKGGGISIFDWSAAETIHSRFSTTPISLV